MSELSTFFVLCYHTFVGKGYSYEKVYILYPKTVVNLIIGINAVMLYHIIRQLWIVWLQQRRVVMQDWHWLEMCTILWYLAPSQSFQCDRYRIKDQVYMYYLWVICPYAFSGSWRSAHQCFEFDYSFCYFSFFLNFPCMK